MVFLWMCACTLRQLQAHAAVELIEVDPNIIRLLPSLVTNLWSSMRVRAAADGMTLDLLLRQKPQYTSLHGNAVVCCLGWSQCIP
jgi:hypothetical protein